MASGSFNISTGNQYVTGKVEWSATNNNANNTSNLTLVAYLKKSSSSSSSSTINNLSVTRYFYVDGVKYGGSEKATITLKNNNTYVKVYEKTITGIKHNDDGSKSLNIGFEMSCGSMTAFKVSKTTSDIVLEKIPRYANLTFIVSNLTETSVKISWSSDVNVSTLQYKLNSGSWIDVETNINKKSGSFTINDLTNAQSYEIYMDAKRYDSGLWCNTKPSKSITTYDYPYCTESPNFTIGNSVNLKFYNPLNRTFTFYIIANGIQISNSWSINGTSYNGLDDPDTSQKQLFQTIPNQPSGKYQVKVVYGSSTKTRNNGNVFSAPETPPDFESFNYLDSNSISVGVTGSNQYIIKNKSILKVVIPSANKMVAKNYSTPDRYEISCSNRKTSVPYSENDVSVELGTINSSGLMNIVVTAYDKRGFPKKKQIEINVIDYTEVSQENGLYRVNNFERDTKLLLKGSFNPLVINNIAKNSVQSIKYRYKESDGEYPSNYTTIIPTINNNKYEYETISFDLDNSKSFLFEIIVVDNFGDSKPLEVPLNEGIPIMFVSSSKRNVGIGCQNEHEEGSLETASHLYCGGNIYLDDGTPILIYRVIDSEGNEVT